MVIDVHGSYLTMCTLLHLLIQHPRFFGVQHNAIEVDYCFGSVLNSCLKPISIDAYLEVPDKKQKWSGRIRQDTDIKLKGQSFCYIQRQLHSLKTVHGYDFNLLGFFFLHYCSLDIFVFLFLSFDVR